MTKYSGQGKTQTNEKLIELFISNKRASVLAFYHLAKLRFNNGVCYDYTPNKLSEILNIPISTIKRLVTLAIENKLCEIQPRKKGLPNLRFFSIETVKNNHGIRANHKCTIFIINKQTTLQEVEDQLIGKLIEQQQRREVFNLNKEVSTQINVIDSKKSNVETNSVGRLKTSQNVVGYRKLASKLGLSHSFVWNVVKRLKQRKFIKTTTVTETIKNISFKEYNAGKKYLGLCFDGYVFYKKGQLITCLGTMFEFKAYPTKVIFKPKKNNKERLSKEVKRRINTIGR